MAIYTFQNINPEKLNIHILLKENFQTRDYKMLKKRSEHLFVCLTLNKENCEWILQEKEKKQPRAVDEINWEKKLFLFILYIKNIWWHYAYIWAKPKGTQYSPANTESSYKANPLVGSSIITLFLSILGKYEH